jgi:AbrB family looped-hinge helix DNA binding protein
MKTTVSEKGQITIPKALRDRLGLRAGQTLEMYEEGGRLVARKTSVRNGTDSVYGVLKLGAPTDTIMRTLRGDTDGG